MVKFCSNDDAKKQIAVVDRPDSNATTAPKIPDGALSQSFGLKTRGNISKTSTVTDTYVVLWAGQSTFCQVTDGNNTTATVLPETSQSNQKLVGLDQDGDPVVFVDDLDNELLHLKPKTQAWRGVSYGMRIRCINTSAANQGSFTARRFRAKVKNDRNWQPWNAILVGTPVNEFYGFHPRVSDFEETVTENDTMSQDPTFVSGAFKDIGKHYFQLNDESVGGHDMITTEGVTIEGTNPLAEGNIPIRGDIATNRTVLDYQDRAFDMIIVHIQGTSGITQFTVDCVANREFQLNELDERKSAETECADSMRAWKSMQNSLRWKNRLASRMY